MLRIQRPRRRGRLPTADPATPGGQKSSRYRDATLHQAQVLCGGLALLVGRLGVWSGDVEATGSTSKTLAGRQFLKPMAVAHYLRAVSSQGHRNCDRKAGLLPGRPARRFTLRSAVMRVRSTSSNGAGSVCRADISGAFFPCLSHQYGLAQDAIT